MPFGFNQAANYRMDEGNTRQRIMNNLSSMFDNVNNQVGQIASQVGTTPQHGTHIYSMIQTLSENVMMPIAG